LVLLLEQRLVKKELLTVFRRSVLVTISKEAVKPVFKFDVQVTVHRDKFL